MTRSYKICLMCLIGCLCWKHRILFALRLIPSCSAMGQPMTVKDFTHSNNFHKRVANMREVMNSIYSRTQRSAEFPNRVIIGWRSVFSCIAMVVRDVKHIFTSCGGVK